MTAKFNVSLVPTSPPKTPCKPCYIIKADGTFLAQFKSRKECAAALSIAPAYISLLLTRMQDGWCSGRELVDSVHGKLILKDGTHRYQKRPRIKKISA